MAILGFASSCKDDPWFGMEQGRHQHRLHSCRWLHLGLSRPKGQFYSGEYLQGRFHDSLEQWIPKIQGEILDQNG